MKKRNNGSTIIEILIVIVVCFGMIVVFMGNFWYTEDGVLRELKYVEDKKIQNIVITQRNTFRHSRIIVSMKDGSERVYLLDTSLFRNHKFSLAPNDQID